MADTGTLVSDARIDELAALAREAPASTVRQAMRDALATLSGGGSAAPLETFVNDDIQQDIVKVADQRPRDAITYAVEAMRIGWETQRKAREATSLDDIFGQEREITPGMTQSFAVNAAPERGLAYVMTEKGLSLRDDGRDVMSVPKSGTFAIVYDSAASRPDEGAFIIRHGQDDFVKPIREHHLASLAKADAGDAGYESRIALKMRNDLRYVEMPVASITPAVLEEINACLAITGRVAKLEESLKAIEASSKARDGDLDVDPSTHQKSGGIDFSKLRVRSAEERAADEAQDEAKARAADHARRIEKSKKTIRITLSDEPGSRRTHQGDRAIHLRGQEIGGREGTVAAVWYQPDHMDDRIADAVLDQLRKGQEIELKGYWKPREWKGPDGTPKKTWEFQAMFVADTSRGIDTQVMGNPADPDVMRTSVQEILKEAKRQTGIASEEIGAIITDAQRRETAIADVETEYRSPSHKDYRSLDVEKIIAHPKALELAQVAKTGSEMLTIELAVRQNARRAGIER